MYFALTGLPLALVLATAQPPEPTPQPPPATAPANADRPLPAEAARRAFQCMRCPLQGSEISRIERFADLEQALRAVFEEELGEFP